MVNDYDIHNENINIVSYTKFRTKIITSSFDDSQTYIGSSESDCIRQCNGSFDVCAQVASHAIS